MLSSEAKLYLEDKDIVMLLQRMGGTLWEKYDKKRVYFSKNKLCKVIGLECEYYKTGNIASAYIKGEKISNCKAKRVLNTLEELTKAYFDFEDYEFHCVCKTSVCNYAEEILEGLQNESDNIFSDYIMTLLGGA